MRFLGLPLFVLCCCILVGCGSSSQNTSGSTSPGHTATASSRPSIDAVASVAGRPIAKSSYEHWLAVERVLGGNVNAGHRALGFLLTSAWLFDEAKTRGVSVSATEVKQRLAERTAQTAS